jgi:hypothetical protein
MKKITNIKLETSKSTKQSVSVEGEFCVAEFSGVCNKELLMRTSGLAVSQSMT